MGVSLTCCACGRTADSTEGYLRPEGFVCGACWAERLDDPAYVRAMEQQLGGLISTISGASAGGRQPAIDQAIPGPRTERDRRAVDSLLGLAVADALGAPWEGSELDPARTLGPIESTERIAFWTDDTQMALSVVEVLEDIGRIDPDALAAGFARRYEPWRGYGAGMRLVLGALRSGQDWRQASRGVFHDGSFGNGSAMRTGPLGAYFHDAPIHEVVSQAELSADVTHSHPEGRAGAVAVAVAAWLAARSRDVAERSGPEVLSIVAARLPAALEVSAGVALAARLDPATPLEDAVAALGNGSRVSCQDTVPLALWLALNRFDDYEGAVRLAIAAGGDADTTAAIVGSVVAARGGLACIPPHWRPLVEPLPFRVE